MLSERAYSILWVDVSLGRPHDRGRHDPTLVLCWPTVYDAGPTLDHFGSEVRGPPIFVDLKHTAEFYPSLAII